MSDSICFFFQRTHHLNSITMYCALSHLQGHCHHWMICILLENIMFNGKLYILASKLCVGWIKIHSMNSFFCIKLSDIMEKSLTQMFWTFDVISIGGRRFKVYSKCISDRLKIWKIKKNSQIKRIPEKLDFISFKRQRERVIPKNISSGNFVLSIHKAHSILNAEVRSF